MSFTVVWKPEAERRLATLWNEGPDRAGVTSAANAIDEMLRRDPLSFGESRVGDRRVIFESPLGAIYSVSRLDRLVEILVIWRIDRGRATP